MNILGALKWAFLSELASKAVTPIVFIVLARILVPEDYGVVAAASMIISFSQIFWEAGMGKAIIQYQGDRSAAANAAFWVNTALGCLVSIVLVAVANVVAHNIFHDPRVAGVLRVMALQVLLSSSVAVHIALFQKDMRFKHLFWVRMSTVAVPGIISIPFAYYGGGYWALVAGTIAGQLLQVLILWRMSSWKPCFSFDFSIARHLAKFGIWVALAGVLAWFYSWADSLVVGVYFGPHELGLYRTGALFVTMLYGLVFGPVIPVLYSYLSGIQDDIVRMRRILLKVVKTATFIAIPLAFIIYANASFLAEIIFGAKWSGVELVIAILALMHGYGWVVGLNGEMYRAIGAPKFETQIMAFTLVFYVAGYWFSARRGFAMFLWTRLALSFVAWVAHMWIAHKAISFPVFTCLKYVLKISLVCSPIIFGRLYFCDVDSMVSGFFFLMTSACFVLGALYALESNGLIPELYALVKRKTA